MKTIILNQRKERDELMSRPYLVRRSNQDIDLLLGSRLIKLITGPRRVGKSTQALLMLRGKNFAYLNFDNPTLQGSVLHPTIYIHSQDRHHPTFA